jgi:hypothetical protein
LFTPLKLKEYSHQKNWWCTSVMPMPPAATPSAHNQPGHVAVPGGATAARCNQLRYCLKITGELNLRSTKKSSQLQAGPCCTARIQMQELPCCAKHTMNFATAVATSWPRLADGIHVAAQQLNVYAVEAGSRGAHKTNPGIT